MADITAQGRRKTGRSPLGYAAAVAVTPHDTNDLAESTSGLYIGGAGAVAVITEGEGTSVIFAAVPVGTTLPIRVTRVLSTGTTATNILALY
jgi:hypothetical protein